MGRAAAEAVADRVGRPHTTAPASVIRLFEECVQLEDAKVYFGDDPCTAGDELVAQQLAPVQVQRKAAQVVDEFLALIPQALAFASHLAYGLWPLSARRRLGFGGLVDVSRHRASKALAGVVTD